MCCSGVFMSCVSESSHRVTYLLSLRMLKFFRFASWLFWNAFLLTVGKLLSMLRHIKQHQWCQFRQSSDVNSDNPECRDTWVSPGNLEEVRSWRNPGREKNQGRLAEETGAEGDKASNTDGQWKKPPLPLQHKAVIWKAHNAISNKEEEILL